MAVTGEPTLREVALTLERIESEFTRRFADLANSVSLMVTRDLYEAHRAAIQDDIADLRDQLKTERERKAADRRMVVSALLAAGLALLVAIVGAALLAGLKLKS